MQKPEFRVRPVIRHVVTRYTPAHSPEPGCMNGPSLETLGEFDSERYAEEVCEALRPREWQYAVIERSFEPECRVFYAECAAEACGMATQLGEKYGTEFRIFQRDKNPATINRVSQEERERWERHIAMEQAHRDASGNQVNMTASGQTGA